MPKPLLLGEVARRSRDGEVEPIVQRLIFSGKSGFRRRCGILKEKIILRNVDKILKNTDEMRYIWDGA